MIDNLTNEQIDHVLRSQLIGRIGCSANGKNYIVPVAYVYDGKYIYAHSREGEKIRIMRKNPNICFQVDAIDNLANWRSAIAWGKYEELMTRPLQARAIKLLNERFTPVRISESAKPALDNEGQAKGEKLRRPVLYRILVEEKTGRYEKNER